MKIQGAGQRSDPLSSDPQTHRGEEAGANALRQILCEDLGRSDSFFAGLMEEFSSMPPKVRARAIRSALAFYREVRNG
jgi:hypothetical protein